MTGCAALPCASKSLDLPHQQLFAKLKLDVLHAKRSWRNNRHTGKGFQRNFPHHVAENRY
jgi:hypothetical protein